MSPVCSIIFKKTFSFLLFWRSLLQIIGSIFPPNVTLFFAVPIPASLQVHSIFHTCLMLSCLLAFLSFCLQCSFCPSLPPQVRILPSFRAPTWGWLLQLSHVLICQLFSFLCSPEPSIPVTHGILHLALCLKSLLQWRGHLCPPPDTRAHMRTYIHTHTHI